MTKMRFYVAMDVELGADVDAVHMHEALSAYLEEFLVELGMPDSNTYRVSAVRVYRSAGWLMAAEKSTEEGGDEQT